MLMLSAIRQRCLCLSLLVLAVTGTAAEPDKAPGSLQRFEFSEPEMGVPFRIVLYAPDAKTAKSGADDAFRRVAQLNEVMSDYETDSELNELSRTSGKGKAVPVSKDLWKVLERAQQMAALSDGAFDITVGPLVNLWRKARRTHQLPDAAKLAEAQKAVGFQKVRLDAANRAVELVAPGMKLDLGGIAKGYALCEAIETLRERGVSRALITGGGDMCVSDPPPGETGWRIEIAPLDVTNAPPKSFVRIANTALATSGDLFQRLEIGGQRYSHIVDPRTGIGLTDHSLVTVIVKDGATADALSTAVSVLGPERGLALIAKIPGAAVHIVRQPAGQIETVESPGFRQFYDAPRVP